MKITELFIDDSGKLSASRVLMFIICVAYLVYAGFLIFRTANMVDIPLNIAGLIALLYGANKFSNTYDFKGNDDK